MIKLMIEDYCHNCPDFHANVDRLESVDLLGERTCDHVIYCLNGERCRTLKRHIEKGLETQQ